MTCLSITALTQLLTDDVSTAKRQRVEEHLNSCTVCADRMADLRVMTERLQVPSSAHHSQKEVDRIMTIIRVGKAATAARPRPTFGFRWAIAPIAAAALIALSMGGYIWVSQTKDESIAAEFQARSVASLQPEQWVSLNIFRYQNKQYLPVKDVIFTHSALAFKYRDESEEPYPYLMILAIDETGNIYWYYPPYTEADANPQSLVITRERGEFQLPDEVTHEYSAGWLRLFGVFSRQALTVKAVESAVVDGIKKEPDIDQLRRIALPGTVQYSRLLKVEESP